MYIRVAKITICQTKNSTKMRALNLILCLIIGSLIFGCVDPDENEENPDLRVVNNFKNYKISNVIVNNQAFRTIDEYLLPGESTEYMNVISSESLIIAYRWQNISDTSDYDDYSRITSIGEYPELLMNVTYTLSYSGDKTNPTINVTQP